MTQNFERVKSRLDNIRAIEPLLGALRTMSMGAWQMALNKLARMQQYEQNYDHIMAEILPHLKDQRVRKPEGKQSTEIADTIILIVGSERGLCGKFNQALANNALSWIENQSFPSYQIWAMGSRMIRDLNRMDVNIGWRKPLPASSVISYQQAYLITQNWMDQYESYAFNQFTILFNQLAKGGRHESSSFTLLPYEIHHDISVIDRSSQAFPPPIIETDPKGIYRRIIQHSIASSFYKILLKSGAAEHSARFNMMQDAKDNAEDIIEELDQVVNAERKRKVTQEMQELASSAGLLDNK